MAGPIRVNEKTPNGGDYSEAFYLDDERNIVEPDKATTIIINECLKDGTIISTTYAKANQ